MFLNVENLEVNEINSDVCIVGAGVAGIAIARELMGTKANVVVLESGSFDPESEAQSLTSGSNSGLSYYDLEETRDRAFGGTSNSWRVQHDEKRKGKLVRLHDLEAIDFEKRDWVPYSGWPFSKSDLVPYYERAHKVFKIGPYRYEPEFWEDTEAKPKLRFKDDNVRTTMFQFANKDVFLSDYKEELCKAEHIKVYLNATALYLNINEYSNRIHSIVATSLDGNEIKVNSGCFILALGGLENPRIMLLSNDRVKKGIGNQNDLVGRFFMEHPHLWSGVFYPSKDSFFDKSGLYNIHYSGNTPVMGKLTLSDEIVREEKILNTVTSLHLSPMQVYENSLHAMHEIKQSLRKKSIEKSLFPNFKTILRRPGVIFSTAVDKLTGAYWFKRHGKNHQYDGFLLNLMSEQSPDPESRITLSRDKDRFGQNRIDLNWKVNSSDIRSIRRFQEIFDRELRSSSLGYLGFDFKNDRILEKIHGGYHHMGTTRMDTDPTRGVVDENCKVHGIDNLFVAGSSVFPTSGYANPTLTIVALALKLADHIMNNQINLFSNQKEHIIIKH